ncbi:MAG: fibro-slime domain-containing protein, partial [Clostridiales bacterium]|nr:fibro-slime domain-containing protein [Clostridiales bacterium]
MQKLALEFQKLRRRRTQQNIWLSCLSALVFFLTAYGLLLHGIALKNDVLCEVEEHTHTPECYTYVYDHCPYGAYEEAIFHTHSEICLDAAGNLRCSLKELTAESYVCPLVEGPDHTHGEGCTEGILTHAHTPGCFYEEAVLSCEKGEHTHTDACFMLESTLGQQESEYSCSYGEHSHGAECYEEGALICTFPEHTHSVDCLRGYDPHADLEVSGDWESTLPKFNGENSAERVYLVAQSQLGYKESSKNFVLTQGTKQGFTRYGKWSGNAYMDWNGAFGAFVIHYSGISEEILPVNSDVSLWMGELHKRSLLMPFDGRKAMAGDLIFITFADGKTAPRVGVFKEYLPKTEALPGRITVIEGDSSDGVNEVSYLLTDEVSIQTAPILESENRYLLYQQRPIQKVYEGEDYTITLSYTAMAGLGENITLSVKEIEQGSEEYLALYEEARMAMEGSVASDGERAELAFARFFDITLYQDGEKVEPAAPVKVSITYHDGVDVANDQHAAAIHFAKDDVEVIPLEEGEAADEGFTFMQDGFSVTGTVVADVTVTTGISYVYNKVAFSSVRNIDTAKTYALIHQAANDKPTCGATGKLNGSALRRIGGTVSGDVGTFSEELGLWTIEVVNSNDNTVRIKNGSNYLKGTSNSFSFESRSNNATTFTMEQSGSNGGFLLSWTADRRTYYLNVSGSNQTNIIPWSDGNVFYLYEYAGQRSGNSIWLDGTNGGLMAYTGSPDTRVTEDLNVGDTYTLPSTWPSPEKYDYKLVGWYDITYGDYYKPGDTMTVLGSHVLYADWMANTYDVGVQNEYTVKSEDTNSFITTHVFDFSCIFNMYSTTYTGSISTTGHTERWEVLLHNTNKTAVNGNETLGFVFRDWDEGNVDLSYANGVNDPDGWNESTTGSERVTTGIMGTKKGLDVLNKLFAPNNTDGGLGKYYAGTGNFLYQYMEEGMDNYDGVHNGYYYYDSALNAASYNQSEGRFYLYDYLERTSDSLKDGCNDDGSLKTDGGYSDILPFNSPYVRPGDKTLGTYTINGKTGTNYQYDAKYDGQSSLASRVGTNYWFGFSSTIKFFLPNATGEKEGDVYGNQSTKGEDMVFYFSGDDDVWVFVDGELVLDIGGMHDIQAGSIDFSTGKVENPSAGPDTIDLEAGEHTLTIYYMERGASQANCRIFFNISPRYSLSLEKTDAFSGENLDGAQFGFFTDADCTKPAELWESEKAYANNEKSTHLFSIKDGFTSCWGLTAGSTYYIKEMKPPETGPDGETYEKASGVIKLPLDYSGQAFTATTESGDQILVEDCVVDSTSQSIDLSVINIRDNATTFTVKKRWQNASGTAMAAPVESVQVQLTQNGVPIGRIVELSAENNWEHTWIGIPLYDEDLTYYTYSVTEVYNPGYRSFGELVTENGETYYRLTNRQLRE